jgi:hypothetical protein
MILSRENVTGEALALDFKLADFFEDFSGGQHDFVDS